MARYEHDREDLIREATRLLPRAEWRCPAETHTVILGVRRPGALSIYFGADPAFHFNSRGELRRAFVRGELWKAERGRLVVMRRQRSPESVTLESRSAAGEEEQRLLSEWAGRIDRLRRALAEREAEFVQGVGQDAEDPEYWRSALEPLGRLLRVAARPNVV